MGKFFIRRGRDIKIKGLALKKVVELPAPSKVGFQLADFRGVTPNLLVKENDLVKAGSPLFEDKIHPEIKIVSSASGRVLSIVFDNNQMLQRIVIATNGKKESLQFRKFVPEELIQISRQSVVDQLLQGGLWPVIRQRPFSTVANPKKIPKSIFIHAMNTEPLAPDIDFILSEKQFEFQLGLDVLKHLTEGQIHLCFSCNTKAKALTDAKRVKTHQFSGPHPSGNVSTHIYFIDPVNNGDIVWYVEAQDVLRIAELFLKGISSSQRYVALTGEGLENRVYVKTLVGASVESLLRESPKENFRYISGSVLRGTDVGVNGYLGFYDSQISVIPEGGKREFLSWLSLGANKYSFSKTFACAFFPHKEFSIDTDAHGSPRPIVFRNIYNQYVALDIEPFFLMRAILAEDIEQSKRLGILECDEEDFALCSFACPSKTDVGAIVRRGLDLIGKEEAF